MDRLLALLNEHQAVLWWGAGLSLVTLLVSAVVIPVLIARMPVNYFNRDGARLPQARHSHPGLRWSLVIAKNLLGAVLIVLGVVMLVLPGQGLLTILIGLGVVDFPGKFQLQRRIAAYKPVWHSINWLRGKLGQPALQPPHQPNR